MSLFKSNKNFFFTDEEEATIIEAIRKAELQTSGEIKVHVEGDCQTDAFERGIELFDELDLYKTAHRNGVLFYLALESHKFAIVADEGINQVVPEQFWEEMKNDMKIMFKAENVVEGVCNAILQAGEQLKVYFPYQADDDENEVSDEISKGK